MLIELLKAGINYGAIYFPTALGRLIDLLKAGSSNYGT
jgi:hypothetical protein